MVRELLEFECAVRGFLRALIRFPVYLAVETAIFAKQSRAGRKPNNEPLNPQISPKPLIPKSQALKPKPQTLNPEPSHPRP